MLHLLSNGSTSIGSPRSQWKAREREFGRLHAKIGELIVELDLLAKRSGRWRPGPLSAARPRPRPAVNPPTMRVLGCGALRCLPAAAPGLGPDAADRRAVARLREPRNGHAVNSCCAGKGTSSAALPEDQPQGTVSLVYEIAAGWGFARLFELNSHVCVADLVT
jgi:hypothetical protein